MTYAANKVPPSNQFVSPSFEIAIVKKTAVIIETSSGMVNTKGILFAKTWIVVLIQEQQTWQFVM